MKDKNQARVRRSKRTRHVIKNVHAVRLTVHRSNGHIYAQVIDATGSKVLACASTVEPEVRASLKNGGNVAAAVLIGKRIAEKAKQAAQTLRVVSSKRSEQTGGADPNDFEGAFLEFAQAK